MRWRGSILLLLVAGVAWGQETPPPSLTVFVRENNSSGRPLEGVQISAPGVSPATTYADGKRPLTFSEHEIGETVELTVFLAGFEVVNDLQRTVTLPKDPRTERLFFLCQPAKCLAEKLSFYRLSADPLRREIETQYQKSLKELADKGLATAKELGRVESERDQALATVDRLTEELAQLKPGEGSSSYRRAVQLFTGGKLEEALQELDAAKLEQARQQARSQLKDVTRSYVLRGRILVAQFRFIEAEAAFEDAVATSPNNLDSAFALAYFLDGRNQFAKATAAYQRSLELARELGNTASIAGQLNNLGLLYRAQNRMEDARKAYEEALESRRQLAAKYPEIYLPDVAVTLNNLGSLYGAQNRIEDARKAHEEALENSRQFAVQNPEIYLPDVAAILNNLGILQSKQNRMEDARKAFEDALRIRRQLAGKNPEVYLPDVAKTLNNLGALYSVQNKMADARKAYEEAMERYRQLAARNSEVYLPYLAGTLNNLGVLHSYQNRKEDARKAYEEALESYRLLAAKNPEVYQTYVATTLNNLGNLHSAQNRMEDARKAYEEALEIRRQLAAKNPEVYLTYVATSLNHLGVLHHNQNRMEDARKAYEDAVQIRRDFAAINPERFLPLLAESLEALGRLEVDASNLEAAPVIFAEALATRKQFAAFGHPRGFAEIAITAGMLAQSYALAGKTADAVPAAQEAITLIDAVEPSERRAFDSMIEMLHKILGIAAAPEPPDP